MYGASVSAERPIQTTDHSSSQSVVKLKRTTDRENFLTDLQITGLANCDWLQRAGWYVDLQNGDVISRVKTDQSRRVVRVISQSNDSTLSFPDHVKIRDDVPLSVPDEAAASTRSHFADVHSESIPQNGNGRHMDD